MEPSDIIRLEHWFQWHMPEDIGQARCHMVFRIYLLNKNGVPDIPGHQGGVFGPRKQA
jgi:hypothetical protein